MGYPRLTRVSCKKGLRVRTGCGSFIKHIFLLNSYYVPVSKLIAKRNMKVPEIGSTKVGTEDATQPPIQEGGQC